MAQRCNGEIMALKLMYITNRPEIATIAQSCGVDRIFVDMEYIGKEKRQPGDTVKSSHSVEDVIKVKSVLTTSELLVRVNPIFENVEGFCGSAAEIEVVIAAGADVIMLPMAKTVDEVKIFAEHVKGRAKTMLLLETAEAAEKIREMLDLGVIDEVHIGLNDLHLSMGKKFMFELLTDGTVERLCEIISEYGLPYGFGGIARLGYGMLPSEYVIAEHYRLGSQSAILSRSFANVNKMSELDEIEGLFELETENIRKYEKALMSYTPEMFEKNRLETVRLVDQICRSI